MAAIASSEVPPKAEKPKSVLMFIVYILKSKFSDRHYVGHTSDLDKRLYDHNRAKVRSTSPYIHWEVVNKEEYSTKSDAYKREMQIKSYKSGSAFKKLLN